MFNTTLAYLRCPKKKKGAASRCGGGLILVSTDQGPAPTLRVFEIRTGTLDCQNCKAKFPILEGVAILVSDVRSYLLNHVKGIAQVVPDSEIPKEFLREYLETKEELQHEHIEEDLEAERVNALYLMNHYLRVRSPQEGSVSNWWKPIIGEGSPLIDSLIREHWDHGPFYQIEKWVSEISPQFSSVDIVELGCGVGGLYRQLKCYLSTYLGIDSSFASIALSRRLAFGVPYRGSLRIPADLLQGPVSREIKIPLGQSGEGNADFIVGDIETPPLGLAQWNVTLSLNTIDMLDNPSVLAKTQYDLIKENGIAVQSCPYIWHELVARRLRKSLPRTVVDSASAAEWIYQKAGFSIEKRVEHLPWLFFKHVRQLEIYSVHLFVARKPNL